MADNALMIGLAVSVLFILVSTTALRLYTRIFILKKTGWEDWSACLALVLFISTMLMIPTCIRLVAANLTQHMPSRDIIALFKISHATEILYNPTMAFAKLSILLQMKRIFIPFKHTRSWYLIVCFTCVNMAWFVAIGLVSLFQCIPVQKRWDVSLPGHCLDYSIWVLVAGIFNMTSDFIMLALPIVWIWRLQMDLKKKLTAGAVFVVGVLACVAGVVRFVFSLKHLRGGTRLGPLSLLPVAACAFGEVAAAIFCANMPLLPAFIKHFRETQAVHYSREKIYFRGPGTLLMSMSKQSKTTTSLAKDDFDDIGAADAARSAGS